MNLESDSLLSNLRCRSKLLHSRDLYLIPIHRQFGRRPIRVWHPIQPRPIKRIRASLKFIENILLGIFDSLNPLRGDNAVFNRFLIVVFIFPFITKIRFYDDIKVQIKSVNPAMTSFEGLLEIDIIGTSILEVHMLLLLPYSIYLLHSIQL